jgi:hypothetical protein
MKQAAYPEELKRTYNQRGDNSSMSTQKGNPGIKDPKYDLSAYGSVDDCVNGPSGLVALGVDSSTALSECQSYFQIDASSDAGKKTAKHANQETYYTSISAAGKHTSSGQKKVFESVKQTSRHINVHNASVEPEIEVPSWAETMIGGPPNLIKSGSTNRVKSASQQQKDQMYEYMRARQISHPDDDVNGVPYNAEMEQLIHERGEYLNDIQEILYNRKIKSGAVKKPVDPRPAWLICLED